MEAELGLKNVRDTIFDEIRRLHEPPIRSPLLHPIDKLITTGLVHLVLECPVLE